jgi:hypothetical protein
MVVIISSLAIVFSDLAVGAALVQRPSSPRETTRSSSGQRGCSRHVVHAARIALAGPVAAFYGEPEVRALFAALSISFLAGRVCTRCFHDRLHDRFHAVQPDRRPGRGGAVPGVVAAAGRSRADGGLLVPLVTSDRGDLALRSASGSTGASSA